MFWRNAWQVIKTIQARLRFIAILAAIGGVIVYWDTLKAYYEKWTRPVLGQRDRGQLRHRILVPDAPDHRPRPPGQVPHLRHAPVQAQEGRRTGEGEALPPGVVSRVQLTPYRVALAGIQTAEVGYQPLTKEITHGRLRGVRRAQAGPHHRPATGKSRIDKLYVNVTGQTVAQGRAAGRCSTAPTWSSPCRTCSTPAAQRQPRPGTHGPRTAAAVGHRRRADQGDPRRPASRSRTSPSARRSAATSSRSTRSRASTSRKGPASTTWPTCPRSGSRPRSTRTRWPSSRKELPVRATTKALPEPRVQRQGRLRPPAPGRQHPHAEGALRHGQPRPRAAAGHVRHRDVSRCRPPG